MRLTLPFDTPSKKNSRIVVRRTGRSFPSRAYQEWHSRAVEHIHLNYPCSVVQGPVSVRMAFTHSTLRRSDADNKVSSILDLLVDCGILSDDNWKEVPEISVANRYVKGVDSCEVEILQIPIDNPAE